MKLILSSCDFRNEKSKKTIINNLLKPIESCSVLFFPNEKATFETIHSEKYILRLQGFGFSKENIIVFDYYNPNQFYDLKIDVIYISGGNTFLTLDRINKCGFTTKLIEYIKSGVIYIGGSAGAHIVTADISHLCGIDEVPLNIKNFSGLGLFDGILICHYTEERKSLYLELKNQNRKVIKLTDDDSLVIDTNNI